MKDRRLFIREAASLLLTMSMGLRMAGAQNPSLEEPPPPGIGVEPDYDGPLPPIPVLGTQYPTKQQETTATRILKRAPKRPTPFRVAGYFLEVGLGIYGTGWQPYTRGWPVRWNPVIVNFF